MFSIYSIVFTLGERTHFTLVIFLKNSTKKKLNIFLIDLIRYKISLRTQLYVLRILEALPL